MQNLKFYNTRVSVFLCHRSSLTKEGIHIQETRDEGGLIGFHHDVTARGRKRRKERRRKENKRKNLHMLLADNKSGLKCNEKKKKLIYRTEKGFDRVLEGTHHPLPVYRIMCAKKKPEPIVHWAPTLSPIPLKS